MQRTGKVLGPITEETLQEDKEESNTFAPSQAGTFMNNDNDAWRDFQHDEEEKQDESFFSE